METVRDPAKNRGMHPPEGPYVPPRLLADIGGTNVRFAMELADGRLDAVSVLPLSAYPSISHAIRSYLSQHQTLGVNAKRVRHAAFAIANPVDGDWVQMTNSDWAFSIDAVRREFDFEKLFLVNDFTALAMALPKLKQDQVRQVGGGVPKPQGVIGLIGAGTGLGVSGLIAAGDDWIPLATEGGRVSFSPGNEREVEILRFAWGEFSHVSAERLLSGMGLELIYRAVANLSAVTPDVITAPEITRRALAQECPICDETVELFCAMLGTVAGNLALTLGAKGGIYIGGGIVPCLGERFVRSGFRQRFEHKGRFAQYLSSIPTYVITAPYPALLGVSLLFR